MAAMLIESKSRMLLPPKKAADGAEPRTPAPSSCAGWFEYEQIKLVQPRSTPCHHRRDFLRAQVHIEQSLQPRWPDVDTDDLKAGATSCSAPG